MKRYIKEMANDVQREIDREIKACRIPFGELAELGRKINRIKNGSGRYIITDHCAAAEIVAVWDKLKELRWENA